MVRIRLRRVGSKKQPSYRIVVADKKSPRDGRFIETIGHFNPRTRPETIVYQEDRALYWLSVGAQPSQAVARLFDQRGTLERLARLHKGEELEALTAEAEAALEAMGPISPKTRYAAPEKSAHKPEAAAVAEAPTEAEAEVAEAEEAEAPAEEPVAEVVEAEETEAVAEASAEAPAEEPVAEAEVEVAEAEESGEAETEDATEESEEKPADDADAS